jgi:hypothetical protein
MKPGDHPEFFRFPAPEGRSRESTLRLDARGRFWHDDKPVEHAGLAAGLHSWISRHPDDGRYILTNGYDWTYFTVEDAPYVVQALRIEPEQIVLLLSDGTDCVWAVESTRVGADGALYATVKTDARGGPYEAKFSPHAQGSLGPVLVDAGEGSLPLVRIGGRDRTVGAGIPRR